MENFTQELSNKHEKLENFTQDLQRKYENLESLVYKFMGGNKFITLNGFIYIKCKTSKLYITKLVIYHIKA